jgi:ribonuclease BN (tRNA processing enzyme)
VHLTILGCSGTFPGPTSPCSSYLFEAEGYRLLVDVGNGATGSLQACCDLLDIDAIVVSHLHGDHYLDLINYTYVRRYHPRGTPPPLPVYGPPGIRHHIDSAFGGGADDLLDTAYAFTELHDHRTELGPFTVDFLQMEHPVETYGMRITDGGGLIAYSADTGATDRLVDVARDADLFLCEASYLDGDDNPPGVHLTGREAGTYAARADARRLLLTHLVPWGDVSRTMGEAHAAYDGDVTLATTHAMFQI